jgi:hypothetical protein
MDKKVHCCRAGDNRWKVYVTDEDLDTYLKVVEAPSKPSWGEALNLFEESRNGFKPVSWPT